MDDSEVPQDSTSRPSSIIQPQPGTQSRQYSYTRPTSDGDNNAQTKSAKFRAFNASAKSTQRLPDSRNDNREEDDNDNDNDDNDDVPGDTDTNEPGGDSKNPGLSRTSTTASQQAKKVYVDDPLYSKADEDQYRFVSSRIDDIDSGEEEPQFPDEQHDPDTELQDGAKQYIIRSSRTTSSVNVNQHSSSKGSRENSNMHKPNKQNKAIRRDNSSRVDRKKSSSERKESGVQREESVLRQEEEYQNELKQRIHQQTEIPPLSLDSLNQSNENEADPDGLDTEKTNEAFEWKNPPKNPFVDQDDSNENDLKDSLEVDRESRNSKASERSQPVSRQDSRNSQQRSRVNKSGYADQHRNKTKQLSETPNKSREHTPDRIQSKRQSSEKRQRNRERARKDESDYDDHTDRSRGNTGRNDSKGNTRLRKDKTDYKQSSKKRQRNHNERNDGSDYEDHTDRSRGNAGRNHSMDNSRSRNESDYKYHTDRSKEDTGENFRRRNRNQHAKVVDDEFGDREESPGPRDSLDEDRPSGKARQPRQKQGPNKKTVFIADDYENEDEATMHNYDDREYYPEDEYRGPRTKGTPFPVGRRHNRSYHDDEGEEEDPRRQSNQREMGRRHDQYNEYDDNSAPVNHRRQQPHGNDTHDRSPHFAQQQREYDQQRDYNPSNEYGHDNHVARMKYGRQPIEYEDRNSGEYNGQYGRPGIPRHNQYSGENERQHEYSGPSGGATRVNHNGQHYYEGYDDRGEMNGFHGGVNIPHAERHPDYNTQHSGGQYHDDQYNNRHQYDNRHQVINGQRGQGYERDTGHPRGSGYNGQVYDMDDQSREHSGQMPLDRSTGRIPYDARVYNSDLDHQSLTHKNVGPQQHVQYGHQQHHDPRYDSYSDQRLPPFDPTSQNGHFSGGHAQRYDTQGGQGQSSEFRLNNQYNAQNGYHGYSEHDQQRVERLMRESDYYIERNGGESYVAPNDGGHYANPGYMQQQGAPQHHLVRQMTGPDDESQPFVPSKIPRPGETMIQRKKRIEREQKDFLERNKSLLHRERTQKSYNKIFDEKKEYEEHWSPPPALGAMRKTRANSEGNIAKATPMKAKSAEQIWQDKSRALSQNKKDRTPGYGHKSTPASRKKMTKYPSESKLQDMKQIKRVDPLKHKGPVEGNVSPTMNHVSPRIQVQPFTQTVWTEDGQRVSVDINLKLVSPPPLGPIPHLQKSLGPVLHQSPRHVGPMQHGNYTTDQYNYTMGHGYDDRYAQQQEMYYQRTSQPGEYNSLSAGQAETYQRNVMMSQVQDVTPSPRDYLKTVNLSPREDEQRLAKTHPMAGTNPYAMLPPIASSTKNKENEDTAMLNGSYAKQFNEKARSSPQYKPYTVNDFRRLDHGVKLGGLGPDRDNTVIKEKNEKRLKQIEYAKQVKEMNKVDQGKNKPPRYPKQQQQQQQSTSEEKDLHSKRTAAIEYAKTVPKPKVVRPEYPMYDETPRQASISPAASPVVRKTVTKVKTRNDNLELLDLNKLQQRHEEERRLVSQIQDRIDSVHA